jgi:hypothetical protein
MKDLSFHGARAVSITIVEAVDFVTIKSGKSLSAS